MKHVIFDYEYYPDSKATAVALDALLDDFKEQPIVINGKPMVMTKERTIKDCRYLDGCIYFHLGKVDDRTMCDLIEKFQKIKSQTKDWKAKGRIMLRNL